MSTVMLGIILNKLSCLPSHTVHVIWALSAQQGCKLPHRCHNTCGRLFNPVFFRPHQHQYNRAGCSTGTILGPPSPLSLLLQLRDSHRL